MNWWFALPPYRCTKQKKICSHSLPKNGSLFNSQRRKIFVPDHQHGHHDVTWTNQRKGMFRGKITPFSPALSDCSWGMTMIELGFQITIIYDTKWKQSISKTSHISSHQDQIMLGMMQRTGEQHVTSAWHHLLPPLPGKLGAIICEIRNHSGWPRITLSLRIMAAFYRAFAICVLYTGKGIHSRSAERQFLDRSNSSRDCIETLSRSWSNDLEKFHCFRLFGYAVS